MRAAANSTPIWGLTGPGKRDTLLVSASITPPLEAAAGYQRVHRGCPVFKPGLHTRRRARAAAAGTVLAVAVALVIAPGPPHAAEAGATGAVWSENLLTNGDFGAGPAPWDLAGSVQERWQAEHRPAIAQPQEGAVASHRLLLVAGDNCREYRGGAIQQRIAIEPQPLQHAMRLRWQMRTSGLGGAESGLLVRIWGERADGPPGRPVYQNWTWNGEEAGQPRYTVPVESTADGEWSERQIDFLLVGSGLYSALVVEVKPYAFLASNRCRWPATAAIDDLDLRSLIVAVAPGPPAMPTLPGIESSGPLDAAALINAYRAIAGAAPLQYDHAGSAGARAHAAFMTQNPAAHGHWEEPALPGYSAAGDAAARASGLATGCPSLVACVESLLTAPYHRFGWLTPDAPPGFIRIQLAFDSGNAVVGRLPADGGGPPASPEISPGESAHRAAAESASPTPTIWPADGLSGVPFAVRLQERPDPLLLCESAPTDHLVGYPITVEFPFVRGERPLTHFTPRLTDGAGGTVPTCVIDGQAPHPDVLDQWAPGSTPAGYPGTVIVIPLRPLIPGERYQFTIAATVNGHSGEWSARFTTAGTAPLRVAVAGADAVRHVELQHGWNLVAWTGAASPSDDAGAIVGRFDQILTYDAAEQAFRRFSPGVPFASDPGTMHLGGGVWIHVTAVDGAVWEQPAFREARSVPLHAGWNLVGWTGPSGTEVADAIAEIAPAVERLFTLDSRAQRFRGFTPGPASLRGAASLDYGDGVWVRVTRAVTWRQPAIDSE